MKVVLITGASGGIGRATALKFAQNGYNVVYHYNNNLDLKFIEKLKQYCNVLTIKADFLDEKQIKNLYDQTISTFGKIDCLINNASIDQNKLIIDENYKSITNLINANLSSTIYLTSLVANNMIKNNAGNIVNISSCYARFGGAGESVYSATKSALTGFTSAISRELCNSNIRANAVAPGLVNTNMNKNLNKKDINQFLERASTSKMALPEEIAEVVYFLASEQSSYINGQTIYVDGGLSLY